MEYVGFKIRNFKGIDKIDLDFSKHPSGPVVTFVGLNESGKTTVLEAISYFEKNNDHVKTLYESEFVNANYNDLVPLKKKANFNDEVIVEAVISVDDDDKNEIIKLAKKLDIKLVREKLSDELRIERKLKYKNSVYTGGENVWYMQLHGTIGKGRKVSSIFTKDKEKWQELVQEISRLIPPILYFPTFLFEFPSRIYLNDEEENTKDSYYKGIVQDILDSLDLDLNIENHIVERALDGGDTHRRTLESVLNKMGNKVSQIVFERWNEIFDNKIPKKDIEIKYGIDNSYPDETLVYLEFQLRDGDSIYLITERSLGFRWFFCFLLFTQFRCFRKSQKNTLFLLDEPASNLHSKAQMQLLESFSKVTENGGKIIFSTHSPYMINPKWLENTFIVKNEGLRYESSQSEYEYSTRETNIKVEKYRDFVGKNPDKETYFQPILDTLDYVPSDLELVSDAVFVEGKNDYYTIKYFIQSLEMDDISIFPGSGSGALDSLISLYLG